MLVWNRRKGVIMEPNQTRKENTAETVNDPTSPKSQSADSPTTRQTRRSRDSHSASDSTFEYLSLLDSFVKADDPPYLTVGTEVSAKYKGAFCEAKVRKVTRSVKVRVVYKSGAGSTTVPDDQIRGTLRVGATCEVKQADKKEYLEATITKIQDCSQYTVVFDDGDITTLRRTALCLKSGRHFAESETLDRLPLTHPEHFGNPVVGSRKGGRRSRQNQDDSEDEETSRKVKQKEEREPDIGKVVCVELGDKKKQKDNWFPGLVVAPTAQETVRIQVKEEYLVRSFKDGRYFTVPKKETTEFTREIAAKVDNNTLKAAVEKALLYLDRDELPPHWDPDLLFGPNESCSDSDDGFDSDSSDDEPREEKDHFVAQLYKFMDDRGTPINKGPTIINRDVDLYKMFKVVQKLGGSNRVNNQNQWKTIAHKLGFGPSVSNHVKVCYKRFLSSFEDFYRKLGCTMVNHPRGNRARHRGGRSLIRDRDRTLSTPTNLGNASTVPSATVTSAPPDSAKKEKEESPSTADVTPPTNEQKSEQSKPDDNVLKKIETSEKSIKTKIEDKQKKKEMDDKQKPSKEPKKDDDKAKPVKELKKEDDKLKSSKELKKDEKPKISRESKKDGEKLKASKDPKKDNEKSKVPKEIKKEDENLKVSKDIKKEDEKPKVTKEKKENEKSKPVKKEDEKPKSLREFKKEDEKPKLSKDIKKEEDKIKQVKEPKKEEDKNKSKSTKEKKDGKVKVLKEKENKIKKGEKVKKEKPTVNKMIVRSSSKKEITPVKSAPVELSVKSVDLNKSIDCDGSSRSKETKETKKLKETKAKKEERSKSISEKPKSTEDADKEESVGLAKQKAEGKVVKRDTSEKKTKESRSASVESFEKKATLIKSVSVEEEQKKKGRKRKETDDKPASEVKLEFLPEHVDVGMGDKLKVYYGPELKVVYEAKVVEVEDEGGEPVYLVHYTGWNTRYDEWIKRGRIAENLSWTPTRGKRGKNPRKRLKSDDKPLILKRTRPSLGSQSRESLPRRSTTPSSQTSTSSRSLRRSNSRPLRKRWSSSIGDTFGASDSDSDRDFDSDVCDADDEISFIEKTPKRSSIVHTPARRKVTKKNIEEEADEDELALKIVEDETVDDNSDDDGDDEAEEDEVEVVEKQEPEKNITKEPEKKIEIKRETEPKGREFDLNQIRSELKGIEKADVSPSGICSFPPEEDDDEEDCRNISTYSPRLSITRRLKTVSESKETVKPNIENALDVYEFTEPEPFEFESLSKRESLLSEGRRSGGRIFNEIDKDEKSYRKRIVKHTTPEKNSGEKPEQVPSSSELDSSKSCEDAFDKLCSSPSFKHTVEPKNIPSCKPQLSMDEFDSLELFEDDQDDDDADDDKLIISESEETDEPLFTYPKLLPALVGSDLSVSSPQQLSDSKESQGSSQLLQLSDEELLSALDKISDEHNKNEENSSASKFDTDDVTSQSSVVSGGKDHEEFMTFLLGTNDSSDKDKNKYEEDPITAAIQRVMDQTNSDEYSNDMDMFCDDSSRDQNSTDTKKSEVADECSQQAIKSDSDENEEEQDDEPEVLILKMDDSDADDSGTENEAENNYITRIEEDESSSISSIYDKAKSDDVSDSNVSERMTEDDDSSNNISDKVEVDDADSSNLTSEHTTKDEMAVDEIEKEDEDNEDKEKPLVKGDKQSEENTSMNSLEDVKEEESNVCSDGEEKVGCDESENEKEVHSIEEEEHIIIKIQDDDDDDEIENDISDGKLEIIDLKAEEITFIELDEEQNIQLTEVKDSAWEEEVISEKDVEDIGQVQETGGEEQQPDNEELQEYEEICNNELEEMKTEDGKEIYLQLDEQVSIVQVEESEGSDGNMSERKLEEVENVEEVEAAERGENDVKKIQGEQNEECDNGEIGDGDETEEKQGTKEEFVILTEDVAEDGEIVAVTIEDYVPDAIISTDVKDNVRNMDEETETDIESSSSQDNVSSDCTPVEESGVPGELEEERKEEVAAKDNVESEEEAVASLLCEETFPGSPALPSEVQDANESGERVLEMPFASAPGITNCQPAVVARSSPVRISPVSKKSSAAEAAPVMDNTPPATPDSTTSSMPISPTGDQEDTTLCKMHRNSFEIDLEDNRYSEEDSLLNVEVSNLSEARPVPVKKSAPPDPDRESDSPQKKRRKHIKRSDSEINNKKGRQYSGRSPRNIGGSDSDEMSENSVAGGGYAIVSSTENSALCTSRSPRPSKYNFYVELDPDLDQSQRIAIVQQKITQVREMYMHVKAQLACIDRRRKKLRRRVKEEKAMKQEVSCM